MNVEVVMIPKPVNLFCFAFLVFLGITAPAMADFVANGSNLDTTGGGTTDINVHATGGVNPPSALGTINSATRASACYGCTLASVTCDDVSGKSFAASASFLPSSYEVVLIKQTESGVAKFGKLKVDSAVAGGVNMTYAALGTCTLDPPPVSGFSVSKLDLKATFTDTSSNTPTNWSWTFGDGGVSSFQNPQHVYFNPGTYSVCLTASNAGGSDPSPACQGVTVSQVTSTLVVPGGTIDFNTDAIADLQVQTDSGCGVDDPKSSTNINGASRGSTSESYDTVSLSDAQAAIYGNGTVCDEDESKNAVILVKTANNQFVKAWAPQNDSRGIRYQFAVLGSGGPPLPNSAFTSAKLDLIVDFTDTSTGTVSGWSWTFGEPSAGADNNSSAENPRHVYRDPGTYNVCLTASNVTGPDPSPHCANVTVSKVPSILVAPGGQINFDSAGASDFSVQVDGGCGQIPNSSGPINSATRASVGKHYDSVGIADAVSASYNSSQTCDTPHNIGDVILIQTGSGNYVKAWVPANDDRGIRYQFQVLGDEPIFFATFEVGTTGEWSSRVPP